MSRLLVTATWDDVPHLAAEEKAELWASIPPYQRDARSKGIPQLGSGAIYPVPESDLLVEPFAIPAHWPQGYGMDVDHKKPLSKGGSTSIKNLRVESEHSNRSFDRNADHTLRKNKPFKKKK